MDAVAASGHVLVLGSGATARSAVASLAELGCRAGHLRRARDCTRARDRGAGAPSRAWACEDVPAAARLPAVLPEVSLVVYDAAGWRRAGVGPRRHSRAWRAGAAARRGLRGLAHPAGAARSGTRGARVVSGFEMLLHQAARQVRADDRASRAGRGDARRRARRDGGPVSLTVPDAAVPLWLVLGWPWPAVSVGLARRRPARRRALPPPRRARGRPLPRPPAAGSSLATGAGLGAR